MPDEKTSCNYVTEKLYEALLKMKPSNAKKIRKEKQYDKRIKSGR